MPLNIQWKIRQCRICLTHTNIYGISTNFCLDLYAAPCSSLCSNIFSKVLEPVDSCHVELEDRELLCYQLEQRAWECNSTQTRRENEISFRPNKLSTIWVARPIHTFNIGTRLVEKVTFSGTFVNILAIFLQKVDGSAADENVIQMKQSGLCNCDKQQQTFCSAQWKRKLMFLFFCADNN